MKLPPYFTLPNTEEAFGELVYVETPGGSKYWVLRNADPAAVITAKRLFPGADAGVRGAARFPAGPRQMNDLLWFLQRWPMAIEPNSVATFNRLHVDAMNIIEHRTELAARSEPVSIPTSFLTDLRPYQDPGVAWLLGQRRTLLADEMGLGKTVQALAGIASAGAWPACLVMQPHVVPQWIEQTRVFLHSRIIDRKGRTVEGDQDAPISVHVIMGSRKYALPPADIYIIHYLLLRSHRENLVATRPRVVVFDEIQELRRAGSQKYSAAHEIAQLADYCWGLSGTPIYNRGGEIWNVTNILEMHCLGAWDSFTKEWCDGYGSDVVLDPEALSTHLKREGLMLRRLKREVNPDLPPKNRLVQPVDGDATTYHKMIARAVELAQREADDDVGRLERGRIRQQVDAITRHATGLSKAHAAAEFVKTILEAGETVLVFAWHHDVVDILYEKLKHFGIVKMTGRETTAKKRSGQKLFEGGGARGCILNLRSSAGIDGLQSRNPTVVFAELDWSPQVHSQCEDRANRDGFEGEATFCYYVVSEFGSDPEMQDRLGLKIAQFRGIMGDGEELPEESVVGVQAATRHLDALMARIRSERAH